MLTRLRLRRDWPLLAIILLLLVTGVFLGANAVYQRDGTVVYWLILLYDYAAVGLIPLLVGLGVATLLLLVLWVLRSTLERAAARPELRRPFALASAGVLLLCLLCSSVSFLLFREIFASTQLESLQRGSHVYHLTYKPTLGFTFVFVVYECDGVGALCHAGPRTCARFEGESAKPMRPAARLQVEPATGAVFAQVTEQMAVACASPESYPS